MNECVTPVLWRLGDFTVTDCAGTWPLAPELFPVAMVALFVGILGLGYLATRSV